MLHLLEAECERQLFVARLPVSVTEEVLTRLCSLFGEVVKVKILPNSGFGGKNRPGRDGPLPA